MRGHDLPLGYHAGMLADPLRIDAYDRALAELVRPGDVVLDIGTGTGVLAMLAARHGARRVHAVESMEVAALARSLVEANGLDHIVTVHEADLVSMEPIEPVDLIIGEWLGRFVVDDQMLDAVAAAHGWAHDDTRWAPSKVDLHLGLLAGTVPALSRFAVPLRGLDLSPALPQARSQPVRVRAAPEALAAPSTRVHTLVPGDLEIPRVSASYLITQPTAVFAILGFWQAALSPSVTLSTGPGHPTHWDQIAWPVPPTPLAIGDVVKVQVAAEPQDWAWSMQVKRRGELVLDHSATSEGAFPGPPLPRHPDAARLGREALGSGDLNAAVSHLGAALCALPPGDVDTAELHGLHGQALARAGLYTEAMDALLAAEAAGSTLALAWLPCVARRLGWPHEAERWRREHLARVGPWSDPLG